ncbi:MAG: LPS export ABC transporter permease LptF [Methylococcales symbiont of Hymedesmia sp. n. MRB-2018]|nr:MAG: LPS export ABC transporter permease LptF [Methylococcales symbiont of Hymedesmia sp. n. MRB-2018]KAF3984717.1 MAG: LPS export ABC transporter permease LptF [Methylococcales symbiont of Hymedesmia sp. n. MRB-2018]
MIMVDLMRTLLAVLSVIVIIIVSRKFIKVLAEAIEGNIANDTVLSILGLNTIIAMSAFLPASIFMAILMVIGRMYRDNEISAIASAGGGVAVIYRAVFLLVIPLSLVATGFSMVATPWAEAKIKSSIHEDKKISGIRGIAAGKFSEYSQGDLVFYTEDIDSDKRMINVFVQNRGGGKLGVATAKYGRIKNLPEGVYLALEKGERIQGIPGTKNFIIENFDEYAVRIKERASTLRQKRHAIPSDQLWASEKLEDVAEIQKRLSIPLAVLFLSFLAIPLAKLSPRGGVYNSLAVAFAIYFIFGNLRRINHSWVVNEIIPVWAGYFWIYFILVLLGGILLIRLYGIKWVGMRIKERGVV